MVEPHQTAHNGRPPGTVVPRPRDAVWTPATAGRLAPFPHTLTSRLLAWLRRDLAGLRAAIAPARLPAKGLYAYRRDSPRGRKRLHLRVESQGDAILFVDVSHVLHLNPTGAYIAKMALDGRPSHEIDAAVRVRFRLPGARSVRHDVARFCRMIAALENPEGTCPLCESSVLSSRESCAASPDAPYRADLCLTYRCNNACAHCYNEPARRTMLPLSLADWRRVIHNLRKIGVPHLIFTGGEPTLSEHLPTLIARAETLGQVAGLNTNGRLLASEDYTNALARAGLDHVQITLASCYPDVHNATTRADSFHETVRGIENALNAGIHTVTNTTITRRNADHLEDLVAFLHHLGVRTFAANAMIYSGSGRFAPEAIPETDLPPLLVRLRDRARELGLRFLWYTPTPYCAMSPVELEIGQKRCSAAEYAICIEPDGGVLPCQSYYSPVGNILKDRWDRIWNAPLFRSFRERTADPDAAGLPAACRDCHDLVACGGGCPIERDAHRDPSHSLACVRAPFAGPLEPAPPD